MAKTFRKSNSDMRDLVNQVMKLYHKELIEFEIEIDLIDAYDSGGGAAVVHHGLPAFAVVRSIPLKDRVMGRGDVEITFDALRVSRMSERQKKALIDHELTHLEFKLNKDGEKTVDDIGRYLFKMKPHDREFGWFESVAMRWGKDSVESAQAREMVDDEFFKKYFLLENLTDEEKQGTEASLNDTVLIHQHLLTVNELNKNNDIYVNQPIIPIDGIPPQTTFEHVGGVIPTGPDVVEESMSHIPIDSPQFLKPLE